MDWKKWQTRDLELDLLFLVESLNVGPYRLSLSQVASSVPAGIRVIATVH